MDAATIPLLVFARAPLPGASKTRLIPALGADGAARLSARMLRRTLATARGQATELWCAPDTAHPVFAECAAEFGVRLHTQQGTDLGQRMAHALAEAFGRARAGVLVGTDCPGLCAADLAEARAALATEGGEGAEAVLGPAVDGGYYLIGLRRPAPELFADMPWGGPDVLAETRRRLRELGWRWHELAPRRDLDRPEDLAYAPWPLEELKQC